MTGNSIDYITKKHFRTGLSIPVTLVTAAVAGLSGYLSVMNGGINPGFAAFAGFAGLSAVFSAISHFSPKTGCTLLRIPIAVNAIVCFFTAMGMFTLGYLFLRQSGTQEYINELLKSFGFNTIVTKPDVTGVLLLAGSVMLYIASACAFFGHRYLRGAKLCSTGTLKRYGFRYFPLISIILFVLAAGGLVVFLALSGNSFIDEVLSDNYLLLSGLLIALLLLHLLLSGLCARALARKTYAFKVFEKQIMKVETNADGTVYVPIKEDKEPDYEEPLAPAKKPESKSETPHGKQIIKEYSPAAEETAEHSSAGEGNIL